jgi:hypothetical protein
MIFVSKIPKSNIKTQDSTNNNDRITQSFWRLAKDEIISTVKNDISEQEKDEKRRSRTISK